MLRDRDDMTDFTIFKSFRNRAILAVGIIIVFLLTLATALKYPVPLGGLITPDIEQMDSGWLYEGGDGLESLPRLPCSLEFDGSTLNLVHDLTAEQHNPEQVLAIQTRYQSIRVWADETLIYEAAQGKEYALSSMWHFISARLYSGASTLRVELTKYDQGSEWELFSVLQDYPNAIGWHLFQTHLPVVLVWLCCMLFVLMLILIMIFMAIRRVSGIPLILALTAFIFLSGTWMLLDSKITTIAGGNYSLTYFFSYCVFYLLPLPLLCYLQMILELRSRLLQALTWITTANAGVWMLLHLLNIVPIRSTTVSVHLLIIIFLAAFLRELHKRRARQKRLVCTFWGILLIFAAALVSIILYHVGLLPPTNSAVLYIWGILALILCMTMDTVMMFGAVWKEKSYIEVYRQLATEDKMTRLSNRNAYELRIREMQHQAPGEVTLILFDIDRMKKINDTYGHQMIALTGQCIYEVFGDGGECYRIGGDEFCVILTSPQDVDCKLREFDQLVGLRRTSHVPLKVSHGWERRSFTEGQPMGPEDMVMLKTEVDKKLYRNKNAAARQ